MWIAHCIFNEPREAKVTPLSWKHQFFMFDDLSQLEDRDTSDMRPSMVQERLIEKLPAY